MAAIPVTIVGNLSSGDPGANPVQKVSLVGLMSWTGLGVGGGPILPPDTEPPTEPGAPMFPIWGPPGMDLPDMPGYPPVAGHPLPPIPEQPPNWTPPPPGSSAPIVPPDQAHPVQPIAIPDYVLVFYPGVGWIAVGRPPMPGEAPPGKK